MPKKRERRARETRVSPSLASFFRASLPRACYAGHRYSDRWRAIIDTLWLEPISAITRAAITEEVLFQPTVCKFCRGSTAPCPYFQGVCFTKMSRKGWPYYR